MSTKAPLDTDGKMVIKVVPKQVTIEADGTIKIDNNELKKFLHGKKIDADTHLILMGSDCGCKCCC